MRRKLRGNSGFTLVEMLAVLLIVALLGLVLSLGVTSAAKVYRQSRFVAESAVLNSTLNTAVSDVLRYAADVRDEDPVRFSNSSYQMSQGCLALDGDGYLVTLTSPEDATGILLVGRGAYAALRLRDLTVTYDPMSQVFTGQYIIEWPGQADLTSTVGFTFRTIANTPGD